MKEEGGVKALYRGLVPTSAGAPPSLSLPLSLPRPSSPGLTPPSTLVRRRRALRRLQLCVVRAPQAPDLGARPAAPPAQHVREARLWRSGGRDLADGASMRSRAPLLPPSLPLPYPLFSLLPPFSLPIDTHAANEAQCSELTHLGRSPQLTYPADLLRRRMQMVGLKSQALGYQYKGAWDGACSPPSYSRARARA